MESKEGIDALFQYATEGILVANENGEIININPSGEKLFGYEHGELIGKKIETLVPPNYLHKHEKVRSNYNENPHARSMGTGKDLFGLKKDGTQIPVEISLSPYSSDNGKFVIAFIIDITIRKQAEEKLKNYSTELENQVGKRTMILEEAIGELEQTKTELNEALEKEKELNELKSRFVSMASHEFRTPLATIMSSLSLVKSYGDRNDKEKQNTHINKIKSSIHNLTDILNDFLSVSKLEEGKIEKVMEQFDITEYITDIISEMKPLAKNGQEFIYNHTGEKVVKLDKKLLTNIFFNLISNAIKFSPEEKPIIITTIVSPASIKISIEDKGMGISKEDQEHLFERFFRGNNATHIQGTGLGLNIVVKYLELMNGTINFESKENQGTTFNITLPQ